jgi:hypothetical protein
LRISLALKSAAFSVTAPPLPQCTTTHSYRGMRRKRRAPQFPRCRALAPGELGASTRSLQFCSGV